MKIRFLFLLTIPILLSWSADAHPPPTPPDTLPGCGVTGDFLERNLDPQLLKQMNAQWQQHQKQNKANGRLSADDPIIYVPVMFHIAHLGEAVGQGANITAGQMQTALASLNNMYRARGTYAGGNDTKIEFVLANCSGIDRANAAGIANYSAQGAILSDYNQQQQIRALFGPEQDKYVNIYVCHKLTGASGWAGFGREMFISYTEFPKIGQRDDRLNTLPHEMGHCLFLYHTFEGDGSCGGCPGESIVCPANGNPLVDGDKVADTPPHRVTDLNPSIVGSDINPCTGAAFTTDLARNFMAYGNIWKRFSPGQIERMRFYLNNSLSRWANSDAIVTPNNQITFSSVPTAVCANAVTTVAFSNNTGAGNPVVLITKGDETVYYADAANSQATFNFPTLRYDLNYAGYNLIEGNAYKIKVVAGCNSKESAPLSFNNLDLYTATVINGDGAAFPSTYLNLCTGTSLALRIKLTYQENGVTIDVPQAAYANFNFQWMLNGSPISGAMGSTYTVNGNAGTYHCVLSKLACAGQTKNSYSATLNFFSSPYAYLSDVANGKNQLRTQCTGSTIKLSSSYLSNSATYSWYKDGSLLPNETGRTLAVGSSGTYKVQPADGACAISVSNSDYISLNIGSAVENYLTASSDSVACNGIYMNGPATGDSYGNGWAEGLTYQWLRNGSELSGATQNSYFTSQEGLYSLRVRQGACESISNGKAIKRGAKNQKPILSAPAAFASGVTYRIYVENPGNSGLQWLKDDQPITGNYNSVDVSTSGVYKLRKGYGDCAIDSDPLTVAFGQSLAPTITADDPRILTCADYSRSPYLSFNSQYFVNTNGFTFRWLKDGVELPLSNFYADKNYIYPYENGQYQLRVTSGTASGVSNPVTVSSTATHSIALTAQSSTTEACQGNIIKLNIPNSTLSGYSGISWIWKKDGITIPGQSGKNLSATQSGTYTATYQGNNCTVISEPLTIAVGGPPPSATLSGHYAIRSGETANLQLTSSAQGPYFFTLSDGTEYLGQAPTTPVPKSPTVSTTYALTSFGTHCGLSPGASGQARIDVTNCAIGVVNAMLSGGTWTTPGIWSCGSIPTALDPVRISDTHTIALPADYNATAKSVELRGSVQYNVNAGLKVGQE